MELNQFIKLSPKRPAKTPFSWGGIVLWGLTAWIACAGWAGGAPLAAAENLERFEFEQPHMGIVFRLVFYAADEAAANRASAAAFARIAELDRRLSDYDPQSELSLLGRTAGSGQKVRLSGDLERVLTAAQALSQRSAGAFDVTVGPVVRLWRRARREQRLPAEAKLAEARRAVGYQALRLDPNAHTAELVLPDMRLDLGGIAKGFAADEALRVLRDQQIDRALVAASGDIVVGAPPPDRDGWRVGIAPLAPQAEPSRYLNLVNQAVSTSGDAWQFVELGGKRYSHIVDPQTGVGLTTRSSVTVVAPTGMTADSLASAVNVLGPERGLALVEATPDAAAFFVEQIDGETRTHESSRMKTLSIPRETRQP